MWSWVAFFVLSVRFYFFLYFLLPLSNYAICFTLPSSPLFPFPTPLLCCALLTCLDSRVVTMLAFRSWVHGFESRLAKNFSFFLSLCVLIFSPISYCIPRWTNGRTCSGSEEEEESVCRFMMITSVRSAWTNSQLKQLCC